MLCGSMDVLLEKVTQLRIRDHSDHGRGFGNADVLHADQLMQVKRLVRSQLVVMHDIVLLHWDSMHKLLPTVAPAMRKIAHHLNPNFGQELPQAWNILLASDVSELLGWIVTGCTSSDAEGGRALPNSIIQVKGLRKVYQIGNEKVVALNHITLDIAEGEFCCLLGTSGSGKSTLLNMLAGLEKPSAGSVVIKGRNIVGMSEKAMTRFRQENIGFVFQSYNLLPALTALENTSLPLVFRGLARRRRDQMAKEILTAVGLGTHLNHRPTQMSGGQQQRVGIARALVSRPAIVFADEPTGNLDTRTTREVMELISAMTARNRQTLVLVTHDMSIAAYAHRIIHISDGNIVRIELNRKRPGAD